MAGREDPVEVVMAGYAAWAAGDLEAFLSALDEDIEWHHADSLPYGGTYRGIADLREAVPRWMVTFSSVRFIPEEVHHSDDRVWVIGTTEGTLRNGTAVSTWFVHAFVIQGGRYRYVREWTDMGRLIAREGADPAG